MKKHSFKSRLLSLMALCSMALTIGSCANDDVAQNPQIPNDDKNLTTFAAGTPTTRTSMESDGKFFWEAGDKIYVKDDNGAWHASSNSPTGKTDNFKFKVPGTYTANTSYEVYYPGKNGNQDQVTISANQSQAEPNTTAHFGAAGDCGMATANKVTGKQQFAFTLNHKAAYLLFLPRTSNTILNKCYLTKVEVNSNNDITDTYTLNPTTGKLTGTGIGKQIIVSTGGSGTYANGFPLTNSTASAATNGAYVVIKPGTHTLKIRYWVKDMVTNVEGTITKTLASATYDQNKYYNITANLNVPDYDGDHYYMWDAQQQYWYGYEWTKHLSGNTGQPTLNGSSSSNYAQSNSDVSRWYNEGGGSGRFDATRSSCKNLPNANEMSWYCMYGDPRWDGNEIWTTMNRIYKGGMWFKKKSVLQAENHYNTEKSADNITDLRTFDKRYDNINSSIYIAGPPSVADAGNYFYLPALGWYNSGLLNNVGFEGYYWSSSAHPWYNDSAYSLMFTPTRLVMATNSSAFGYRAESLFE